MRALFINPGGIGDQILLLPVVKLLHEKYPRCEIDLITEPRSSCISELTNLYRKVREFDFKQTSPNILQLRELIRKRKYNFLFSTGASLKANIVASLGDAEYKIGFYSGLLSYFFLTESVKLNLNQYTSNTFSELLAPIIPNIVQEIKEKDLIPEIKLNLTEVHWAKEILTSRIKGGYNAKKIFIHPGVSKLSIKKNILKGWSVKNWALLIEKLVENSDNTVVILGGRDDVETISEIHKKISFFARPKNFFDLSTHEISIVKLAALISASDLLVCVDSAPLHIAVALGKKVVAFFGPTDPKKLLPNDQRFKAVHVNNLECRPCLFDTRKQSCSTPNCLNISPEVMLEAINEQLNIRRLPT